MKCTCVPVNCYSCAHLFQFSSFQKLTGCGTDGGMAEYCRVNSVQVFKISDDLPLKLAVLCEPFSCILNGFNIIGACYYYFTHPAFTFIALFQCFTGLGKDGGMAEYCRVNTEQVFKIADDLPLKVTVLCEPFSCILNGLSIIGAKYLCY